MLLILAPLVLVRAIGSIDRSIELCSSVLENPVPFSPAKEVDEFLRNEGRTGRVIRVRARKTILAFAQDNRPLILAHYMPWYESKPISGHWGWHWTMNHFDPDKKETEGRQQLASQFRPLIGAYDSSDPDTLECQTLQMKFAGIDGVLIDWDGTKDLYDYSLLNRNAGKMIAACAKVGLKFSIVMEDNNINQLVKAGRSTPEEYGKAAIEWLNQKWFNLPGFVRWNGRPVLLMFGPQVYKDQDLNALFGNGPALFTLQGRRGPAQGAFGWPEPQVGNDRSWDQLKLFYSRSKPWPCFIGVAYPRFEDIYKQAGAGPGYGEIRDDSGTTFKRTLELAEGSHAPFIQLATWNDWGEGTQVEPSVEFGYRDLELLQDHRRQADPAFRFRPADLRLPYLLYRLRKAGAQKAKLDQASQELRAGHSQKAATLLSAASRL